MLTHRTEASGVRPAVFAVDDLFEYLEGTWTIARTVDDRSFGREGSFAGQGVFTPTGTGLLYQESGMLRFGTNKNMVEQAYHYHFPTTQRAEVTFLHGGFFHDLDLSAGTWSVSHACGDDLYRGTVRAFAAKAWDLVWRIGGPRKDQVLRSLYRRR